MASAEPKATSGSAPARILCVHQGYELYGSDRSFVDSVEVIRDSYPHARVEVLIPRDGALAERLGRLHGITVMVADIGVVRADDARRPLTTLIRTAWMALRAARRLVAYDAVYINTVVVADYILATRFVRLPAVVHVREIPPSTAARLAFSLLLAASATFTIFNSEQTRRSYRFVDARRSAVVHNGVDGFDASAVAAHRREELRLLMIGRIHPSKGQGLLLEALALLPTAARSRVRLRIVGDTSKGKEVWRSDLERRVAELGLEPVVELLPFTPAPAEHYLWADAIVVPSIRPESFGRVAVEAMSAGRPVLAADHGGITEIVRHGTTGLRFAPGDAHALKVCLQALVDDRDALTSMGAAARRVYEAEFSLEAYRSRLPVVLDRVFPR